MTDPCCRYHTTAVVLTTIYSPFTEGTSRVMKTNEGNSLLWGASVAGAPFGPRGSVAWVPVLGLLVVVGSYLLRTYDSRGAKASCAIVMVHLLRCSNSVIYTKPVGVENVVQLLFVVVD